MDISAGSLPHQKTNCHLTFSVSPADNKTTFNRHPCIDMHSVCVSQNKRIHVAVQNADTLLVPAVELGGRAQLPSPTQINMGLCTENVKWQIKRALLGTGKQTHVTETGGRQFDPKTRGGVPWMQKLSPLRPPPPLVESQGYQRFPLS